MTEIDPYDDDFFADLDAPAASSAVVVLEILGEHIQPRSVVDVGCGTGQWLKEARRRFGAETLGIDGRWNTSLASLPGEHEYVDFESGLSIGRRFDLAICLEVAEHLTASTASRLFDELCASSDAVLFSGAVEEQPGEHHINCRWQSQWMSEFELREFACFDFLRPLIWDNDAVAWWYKQNVFLAVKRSSPLATRLADADDTVCEPTDIVHPENYVAMMQGYARENVRVWDELSEVKRTFANPSSSEVRMVAKNYSRGRLRRLRAKVVPLLNRRGKGS